MYSKKMWIFVILSEIIIVWSIAFMLYIATYSDIFPLNSPMIKLFVFTFIALPICIVCCIIGLDNSLNTAVRIIAIIFMCMFVFTLFAVVSLIDFEEAVHEFTKPFK